MTLWHLLVQLPTAVPAFPAMPIAVPTSLPTALPTHPGATPPPQLFDAAAVAAASAITAAWTPVSTGVHLSAGQWVKSHRFIRNTWTHTILVAGALLFVVGTFVAGRFLGFAINPLLAGAWALGHLSGAFSSSPVYKDVQRDDSKLADVPVIGPILAAIAQPGPNNNPADHLAAAGPPPGASATAWPKP